MAAPHHWPDADCREALRLKDCGMTWREVGAAFGKSRSSAQAAVRRYIGLKVRQAPIYGPPIGLEQSEIASRKHGKNACDSLRRAINALFDRMPPQDVAEVVGKLPQHVPGTERIHSGQMAQRRLAA